MSSVNNKIQKSKLQIETKKSKYFKKYVDWRVKIGVLRDQMSELVKFKKIPVFSVILILLKTQLIEFELKQLITTLDLHLSFSNRSKILKKKIRTPKDMDDKRMTLGVLIKEIEQYEGKFLKDLQNNLPELNRARVKFVHKVFDLGSIDELIKESERDLIITNKIIEEIEKVNKFLEKHGPLKT